jgi:hypothetical protein
LPNSDTYAGYIYLGVFLIFNGVIVINLVVAILSNIFSNFAAYGRGLYNDMLIRLVPIFKYHKSYGSMACAYPPMSILMFAISPFFYLLNESSSTLKILNKALCILYYIPVGIAATIIFFLLSLLCIPYAYICALVKKYKIIVYKKNLNLLYFAE